MMTAQNILIGPRKNKENGAGSSRRSFPPLADGLAKPCAISSRPQEKDPLFRLLEAIETGQKNVNRVYRDGTTPLMRAARAGDIKVVLLYLECGANPHTRDQKNGETAEQKAIKVGHYEIAVILREAGRKYARTAASC